MHDPASPIVNELFRIAVHEAGHALIAYILRRPIVRAYVLPAAEAREEVRGAVGVVDTERVGARTELKLTLAGMIAECVCGLGDPDNWYRPHNGRHYAQRDVIDATNISITLSPNVLRRQRIFEKLSAETGDVLLANKTALLTLAKELQSRLELDRNGVYKILRTAGVKRGWRANRAMTKQPDPTRPTKQRNPVARALRVPRAKVRPSGKLYRRRQSQRPVEE
jgi:hypothetical protein